MTDTPDGYIAHADVRGRGWTVPLIRELLRPTGLKLEDTAGVNTSPWAYRLDEVERLEREHAGVRDAVEFTTGFALAEAAEAAAQTRRAAAKARRSTTPASRLKPASKRDFDIEFIADGGVTTRRLSDLTGPDDLATALREAAENGKP
ncbi:MULTISPECIES: hypothetical protein [Mycobacteroides]|uniref:hypothetical protein n=1 Tax=Mycobacteroides TaxID=670516 RepID=UPI0008A9BA3A|nr:MULTISPECIES: hypothetical protein [Mycobacteroides]AYM40379.1 hypothetical protein DYE20_01395 [[Mycobacterium] chelonae subsp. gwanakae]OHU15965.1 hypothetical protein BKG75_13050 [Mycobacteroides chelonae]SIF24124.1 Uncharacterised protein [Mycobacteroides abscessus subsp. abscessus]SIF37917.1 Uncharacterised protein [Mycobacteroides abscessus subsp. abscessus]SIF84877.1 Uncharacterised protein [Mycobacteroides abscessus subsp. abscessus]